MAREALREQSALAQAIRMSRAGQEDWDSWQRDVLRMTEVPRGR